MAEEVRGLDVADGGLAVRGGGIGKGCRVRLV